MESKKLYRVFNWVIVVIAMCWLPFTGCAMRYPRQTPPPAKPEASQPLPPKRPVIIEETLKQPVEKPPVRQALPPRTEKPSDPPISKPSPMAATASTPTDAEKISTPPVSTPSPMAPIASTPPDTEKPSAPPAGKPSPMALAASSFTDQGQTYIKNGKPDEAIRVLERAVNMHPQNGDNYYYLAEAWLMKRNAAQAKEYNYLASIHAKSDPEWISKLQSQQDRISRLK
jgi:hypothetical protein